MAYSTAAVANVTAFGGRGFGDGDFRRTVFGGIVLGLGSVTAVGAMIGCVTVAAAGIIAALHTSGSNLQVKRPFALGPAALTRLETGALGKTYRGVVGAIELSTVARALVPSTPVPQTKRLALATVPAAPALATPATLSPAPQANVAPHLIAAPHAPVKPSADHTVAALPPPPPPSPPTPLPTPRPQNLASQISAPQLLAPQIAAPQLQAPQISAAQIFAPQIQAAQLQAPRDIARAPSGPAAHAAEPEITASIPPQPAPPAASSVQKLIAPQGAHAELPLLAAVDNRTAIYDIEAHVVYLPSGERMEAHSGLGQWLDDPHHVNIKDRGATPPNVYDLVLRDGLFHGVQAIRLNPVGEYNMYGRDGILAHPYMLGPSGQSFGCVSFKDYEQFLHAFTKGEVARLVVVPHLDGKPPAMARAGHDGASRYAFN